MTSVWSALWYLAPSLALYFVLLLMLRRQAASNKRFIEKLEVLKQSLEALNIDTVETTETTLVRPQHDPVGEPQTRARSRLRTLENLLRRR
jgi:hypothetical protein